MQKTIVKYTELFLFYGSLSVSLAFIAKGGYNPSIDGPAHMYNARIIQYLFSGNALINQYYSINKVPIPNLTDHFVLAFFYLFFSPMVSVKLLLILCVAGLALGFRAIIAILNPGNIGFSAFAIPLAHSFLYYIGFYNFCLSLGFMLWGTYYYLRYIKQGGYSIKRCVMLFILIMLTYFTNGLAFIILGFMLCFMEMQIAYTVFSGRVEGSRKASIRRLAIFSSLWIPGIICFLIFTWLIPMHASNGEAIPFTELLKWIVKVRPLIIYKEEDKFITNNFFYLLVALSISMGIYCFRYKENKQRSNSLVFLIAVILMLVCYFIIPNGASVGMMSLRFCTYVFLFFMLWISLQENFKIVKWAGIATVYTLYWILMLQNHLPVTKDLNGIACEIVEAGKLIKPNSVVHSVNCTDNWLMDHFSDYALLNQPAINPENYEANIGWFPVVWNYETKPEIYLNDKVRLGPAAEEKNNGQRGIDYIFVLGNMDKILKQNQYPGIKKILNAQSRLLLKTNDSLIHLYSINNTTP